MNNHTHKFIGRRDIVKSCDLGISKTTIGEARHPRFFPSSLEDISILRFGTAQIVSIQSSVSVKCLSKPYVHLLPRFTTTKFGMKPSYHVLPHVKNKYSGARFFNRLGCDGIHNLDGWIQLIFQFSSRSSRQRSLIPCRIIESVFGPTTHFKSCIINFSVKFAVGTDWSTGSHFPGIVATYTLPAAININYLQAGKQPWKTEPAHCVHPFRGVTSVSQCHTNGIVSLP